MKNKEVNDVLNTINDFIKNKKYEKASDYIKQTQKNLEEENSASEYIDELVKNLS